MAVQGKKYLIFSLQGSQYALDLNQVAEVSDPRQTWPIPMAPSYYPGAISFHGDVVAVMDTSLFLGLSATPVDGKLVIIHPEIASLAFLVDAIVKIVPEEDIEFTDAPTESKFALAQLTMHSGVAALLDLDAILCCAEEGMIKSDAGKK